MTRFWPRAAARSTMEAQRVELRPQSASEVMTIFWMEVGEVERKGKGIVRLIVVESERREGERSLFQFRHTRPNWFRTAPRLTSLPCRKTSTDTHGLKSDTIHSISQQENADWTRGRVVASARKKVGCGESDQREMPSRFFFPWRRRKESKQRPLQQLWTFSLFLLPAS